VARTFEEARANAGAEVVWPSAAPRGLRRVTSRLLSRAPEDRYPEMRAVIEALEASRDDGRSSRPTRWRWVAVPAAVAVGLGVVAMRVSVEGPSPRSSGEASSSVVDSAAPAPAPVPLQSAVAITATSEGTAASQRAPPLDRRTSSRAPASAVAPSAVRAAASVSEPPPVASVANDDWLRGRR
jgi:hypothetical protein